MGGLVWRVLATGATVIAGVVANKAVTTIWGKTGRNTIADPQNPHTPAFDALAMAALTGLAAALARTFFTRKAAQYYENSSGHLPQPMLDKQAQKA